MPLKLRAALLMGFVAQPCKYHGRGLPSLQGLLLSCQVTAAA